MRLLRLDLEKYGAFEGRSLAFRPDARLHVVFGPNEAGKSSALAAVADLLFGFAKGSTLYSFRFATKELRLGALIANRLGEELTFRRRKGDKATLIDLANQPLRDDALTPFLGALEREAFERAFGLTAKVLSESGKDLLKADGEAGAVLFAAASGLRGLEDRRRAIEDEADALFRPQASTRRFNDEHRAYEAARKEVSAAELGQAEWKRLNEAIETQAARHAALGERLLALRTERARAERLGRAHRAAASVDEAARRLEAVGDAAGLDPAAADALARALDASDAASGAAARAAETLAAAEAEVALVALDAAALEAAERIDAAHRESGAFATLRTDLPRVEREAAEREAALVALARRLGLPDAASVEATRPTDAARAELRALIEEGRERARASAAREAAIETERRRLAALEAERGGAEALDPRPLREAFAALGPRLRTLDRRDELASEAAAETRALTEAAGRLDPAVGDLDALAARPIPSAETIARSRAAAELFAADRARAAETLAKERAELARAKSELTALASAGPLASPEAIRAARDVRDAQWEAIRLHLVGAERLEAGPAVQRAAALDRAIAEADRLADRAAEDAGRVAEEAALRRRAAELAERAAAGEARAEALAGEEAALRDAWRALWSASGIAPGPPAEMEAWRREVVSLLERRERGARRRAELDALDRAEAALRPEIASLAASAGLDGVETLSSRALGARLQERLASLADRWQAAGEAAAALAEAGRRLAALKAEDAAARTGAEARAADWAKACAGAGLGPDASLSAAAAALAAWDEAPGLIDERDYRLKRIRGMRRDAEAFEGRLGALVSEVAPDLADLPPDAAARRLNERLAAARETAARRADAVRRLDEAKGAAALAGRRLADAEEARARAAEGCPDGADLRALVAQAGERERLAATLAERRGQLALVGERADEDALRAELEGFDPDLAPAAIEALKAEEARLEAEDRQVYAELAAARERRAALGGAAAERAAARQRAAGAALAATAREWAVLKVAGLLIGAALERARAADRSPTLDRAADLFRTLTGGAFSGFAQDFEKDAPTLVALRASGEKVGVSGLSEGTRDQFYLALRLASVEDYAARAEAPPFIGDDLFASFDDARTANGLRALIEIGASVQPILFTHHRSVVEAARALGDAADVIEITP